MTFPAEQIAQLINGRIEGDGKVNIRSFGKIEEAKEGELSFLANPKYEDYLYTTSASVVIIGEKYELRQQVKPTLIRVKDPYTAFAMLLSKYQEMMQAKLKGIQDPVHISPTAVIGKEVYIGAFTYIGDGVHVADNAKIYPQSYIGDNVVIGANTTIYAGVRVYHHCRIGSNVIIHSGTVIGSDGFGFAPQPDGSFQKVPQIGNVVIEDNVEIGANTSIDRATMGSTIIRAGAKLDNLIQVAHNVEIGNMTVIAAQAGISGSSKIGNGVMIGGQAGIAGHLQVADGSKINAQAGLGKSLKSKNSAVTGSPAYEYNKAIRSQAMARNIPEMEKRIQELEKLVKSLLARASTGS